MKTSIFGVGMAVALFAATTFSAEQQKMTCRVTGKQVDQCCCEMKGGKFYCKLTRKTYDQCCCDTK